MNQEWMYFLWWRIDGKNNTDALNQLQNDGWFPLREARPSSTETGGKHLLGNESLDSLRKLTE